MSKVEELLAKYNPNGVFQSDLREVSSIIRGKRVTKRDVKERGDYPVISGGESPMGYYDTFNREANTITIAQYGAAGYVDFQKNKFWANDVCYSILPFESVNNKYLYYTLKSKQNYIYSIRNTDAVPFSLPINTLYSIQISLPHIKVQEEIVKILDSFTNLIDALNEELSLRQKQFEYYREKLLTFDDNVKRLSFGDDFSLKARIGWQGLTKKEYRKTGDYYLITGTDFKEGNKIDFSTCVYVDEDRYTQDPNIQIKPNDVLITKDGTLGKVAFIERMDKPATLNGGVFVVRSNVNGVHPKYVAYYLSSSIFKNWIEQNHTNGSIMHLTQKMLVNFEIAMPSISIQQSIVEKLDAFESLILSLKEEIALRQKQYEYYREKLLTFN